MILDVEDAQLHYDVEGDGAPLLWLHGHFGLGSDWRLIFGDAPAGCRMIAPDLRGHGRSTGAALPYSFKQSALDALVLLDRLQIDTVQIVGLSGGGISALHLAMLAPSRVRALVAISAPPAFPEQARAIQRGFSAAALGDAALAAMRQRHPRDGQVDALIAQVRAMPDGGDPAFTAEQLGTIAADTLIVFGDRDPLYPVTQALELRAAIPRAWLWVVPNGGHGPVFGDLAKPFVETTLKFFGGAFRPAAAP